MAGKIVQWGQISTAAPGGKFEKIAQGGASQSLAIHNNGSLELWGVGDVPALPSLGGDVFIDAALGLKHLIAIRADKSIWTHGDFVKGGSAEYKPGLNASAVASAAGHWLAIHAVNQTIHQWPAPAAGAALPPLGTFTRVSARNDYSIALHTDGRLFGWGGSMFPTTGLQGLKHKNSAVSGPAVVNLGTALLAALEGWEYDGEGHFFVRPRIHTRGSRNSPTLRGDDRIVDIAAGVIQKDYGNIPHILALRADGSVSGWGANRFGETNATPGVHFTKIAAGLRYSIGIDNNGLLEHWGEAGPLSTGKPPGTFVSIGAGARHAAAVTA